MSAAPVWSQDRLTEAEAAFRAGRYDEAINLYRTLVRREPKADRSARGLVSVLSMVGKYDEAERVARSFIGNVPSSPELWNSLGQVLYRQGRLEEAAAAFEKAIELRASDELTARLNLAVLTLERGEHEEAMAQFDGLIDVYNTASELTSSDLMATGRAIRYLGEEDPQLYKDALRVLDEAIATDPGDPEPRVQVGELFLEKYNSADALSTFKEVLEINPTHPTALLGLARRAHFDGVPESLELTRRSLEVNSNFVAARVFLAELYLELESYDKAAEEAARALSVNPASLEALATLAATEFLRGREAGFSAAQKRAQEINPRYAGLHVKAAEVSARNRLYREAADFAGKAVELDPSSWRAYALLGLNQLRLGEIEAGRENLETAFDGDPYDIWTKNTLDLLDTFDAFTTTASPRFRFYIDGRESELLTLYYAELAEEAYDRLAGGYGFRPQTPVRVEVYRSHADFSVRTIGLAGLGALGVSFGPVIAMDSPSAREVGHFNWGSTFWHELAHTFHLEMTHHMVPRWFSEGLAVFEERRAYPGWGGDVSPGFLVALLQDRLLALEELNNGFIRPTYPQQVIHSYYQASLVCEFISQQYGYQALVDMLAGYREGLPTSEVVSRVLDTSVDELNEAFFQHTRTRFAGPLTALRTSAEEGLRPPSAEQIEERAESDPSDFTAQLTYGRMLFDQHRYDEAEPYLERAKELFPEYAGGGSSYWYLALIHKERGSPEAAAKELDRLVSINGQHYQAYLELALLRRSLGDLEEAARALDRAVYIFPGDVEVHESLAELAHELGQHQVAIRERAAIVALDPVDLAGALYELARAYQAAGDLAGARRMVLRALERAPNFEQAQDLLLELHGRGSGGK